MVKYSVDSNSPNGLDLSATVTGKLSDIILETAIALGYTAHSTIKDDLTVAEKRKAAVMMVLKIAEIAVDMSVKGLFDKGDTSEVSINTAAVAAALNAMMNEDKEGGSREHA